MARSFYSGLRAEYRGAFICFLAAESLSTFDDTEFCDEKIILTKCQRRLSQEQWRLGQQLRRRNFDLAISLPTSFSSAFLLYLSGAQNRIGFRSAGSDIFLTASLPWLGRGGRVHKSALYFQLLQLLKPDVERFVFRRESIENRERLLVLAPGASITLREWPYFQQLLEAVSIAKPDYKIAVVGAARESKWHQIISEMKLKNVVDLVEKTSLKEIIALCRRSTLVVSNDSGVAHLSATLASAPTLVLFGPGDPHYIAPVGPDVISLRIPHLRCSPCERAYCRAPYGYQACLSQLTLEEVLAETLQRL